MKLNRVEQLFLNYTKLLKVYLLMIVIMTIVRIVFVGYFGDFGQLTNFRGEVIKAFFLGWKYDTIVVSYITIPMLLITQVMSLFKSKILNHFQNFILFVYYFLIAIVLVSILISDLGFYSYFQDHINILFFGLLEDDTSALFETVKKNYPIKILGIGLIIYSLIISKTILNILKKQSVVFQIKSNLFTYFFITSTFIVLLFGGARGGYGDLVLAPKYSEFSENEFINQIAINGAIALEKTIKLRSIRNNGNYNMAKEMGYSGIHEAYEDYLGFNVGGTKEKSLINLLKRKTPKNTQYVETKRNVILLVMESFGANWIQYNEKNFNFMGSLEKHFNEDFLFPNFISSENGTIGSMMTLLSNIPTRPGKRYLSESKYMRLPLEASSHKPYEEAGYETTFVYGGKLGWRDIGKYVRIQGYNHIIGENHIKSKLQLKGDVGTEWGLYDEHFFNYIFEQLESSSRPKFFVGLSTSNHPPFQYPKTFIPPEINIPKSLKGRISREEDLFIERFKAFSYANDSLAKFIERVKKSKFGKNTIIAVTGDHNFWGFMNYNKNEAFKKYTVPFYLYIPQDIKKKKNININKIGSHEDIMTTLYNLSLSEKEYLSFGEDLFSEARTIGINSSVLAGEKGVIYKNKNYHWAENKLIQVKRTDDKFEQLEKRYKSTMVIVDQYLEDSLLIYKESN